MSRRKSRILAFQALYSIEVGKIPLEAALQFEWNSPLPSEEGGRAAARVQGADEESVVFARMLVAGTMEHLSEIDGIIRSHLKTWDFERVNRVSLSILRMSVYSLMFQPEVQPSIVIDEAIHIAKDFGPDDSFKFVNAILDNIRKFLNGKKSGEIADNEG